MRARHWLENELAEKHETVPVSLFLVLVEGDDEVQILEADEFI